VPRSSRTHGLRRGKENSVQAVHWCTARNVSGCYAEKLEGNRGLRGFERQTSRTLFAGRQEHSRIGVASFPRDLFNRVRRACLGLK
jgi:hypothetical protein